MLRCHLVEKVKPHTSNKLLLVTKSNTFTENNSNPLTESIFGSEGLIYCSEQYDSHVLVLCGCCNCLLVHVDFPHVYFLFLFDPGQGEGHVGIVGPTWVDPLVQVHQHCVLRPQLAIKDTLHVAMRT